MPKTRPTPAALTPVSWQADAQLATRLGAYRLYCILVSTLVPAFWVVYRFSTPGAYDPLWLRLLLTGISLGLLLLSYTSAAVRVRFPQLVHALFYVLTFWFVGIATRNAFSPDYAVGLLFVFAAVAIAFGTGVTRTAPLSRYVAGSLLLTVVALWHTPDPSTGRLLFAGCMASAGIVTWVTAQSRIRLQAALTASERTYRKLFDAAGDGIFILQNDRITHCNSRVLTMFGYTRDELIGATPYALSPPMQPDGSASRTGALERIAAACTGIPQEFTWQHRRRDGSLFDAEITLGRIDLGERVCLQAIVRDVTERMHYEHGLIEARDRAEELLRVKTALLNNMSHEIRTPLTGIIGFAELLANDADGRARDFAELIHSGGQRLLETLNSVLDLAHLEAGSFALHPERVDVGAAAREAVALLQPLAARKGLVLRLELPAGPMPLHTDRAALHRILFNLLSNALKFTASGNVTLRVTAAHDSIRFAVEDTGVGIAQAFLPHLFDEFKQESSGFARSHEGAGLGLTITHRLVTLLGGRLDVASTKHVGSTFTVSLPHDVAVCTRAAS